MLLKAITDFVFEHGIINNFTNLITYHKKSLPQSVRAIDFSLIEEYFRVFCTDGLRVL